ncbi:hypothetical protein AB3X96_03665 [Paraburkholderia sp. BR13439]
MKGDDERAPGAWLRDVMAASIDGSSTRPAQINKMLITLLA